MILRAALRGLVTRIALIAANNPDPIFAEDFTVLGVSTQGRQRAGCNQCEWIAKG